MSSSKAVVVQSGIAEPHIECEFYGAGLHVELEFAERAVVVLPAALLLFEEVVAKGLNGLSQRLIEFRQGVVPKIGAEQTHRGVGEWAFYAMRPTDDVLDLATVALTIKADVDAGDVGSVTRSGSESEPSSVASDTCLSCTGLRPRTNWRVYVTS